MISFLEVQSKMEVQPAEPMPFIANVSSLNVAWGL